MFGRIALGARSLIARRHKTRVRRPSSAIRRIFVGRRIGTATPSATATAPTSFACWIQDRRGIAPVPHRLAWRGPRVTRFEGRELGLGERRFHRKLGIKARARRRERFVGASSTAAATATAPATAAFSLVGFADGIPGIAGPTGSTGTCVVAGRIFASSWSRIGRGRILGMESGLGLRLVKRAEFAIP